MIFVRVPQLHILMTEWDETTPTQHKKEPNVTCQVPVFSVAMFDEMMMMIMMMMMMMMTTTSCSYQSLEVQRRRRKKKEVDVVLVVASMSR